MRFPESRASVKELGGTVQANRQVPTLMSDMRRAAGNHAAHLARAGSVAAIAAALLLMITTFLHPEADRRALIAFLKTL